MSTAASATSAAYEPCAAAPAAPTVARNRAAFASDVDEPAATTRCTTSVTPRVAGATRRSRVKHSAIHPVAVRRRQLRRPGRGPETHLECPSALRTALNRWWPWWKRVWRCGGVWGLELQHYIDTAREAAKPTPQRGRPAVPHDGGLKLGMAMCENPCSVE